MELEPEKDALNQKSHHRSFSVNCPKQCFLGLVKTTSIGINSYSIAASYDRYKLCLALESKVSPWTRIFKKKTPSELVHCHDSDTNSMSGKRIQHDKIEVSQPAGFNCNCSQVNLIGSGHGDNRSWVPYDVPSWICSSRSYINLATRSSQISKWQRRQFVTQTQCLHKILRDMW